LPIGDPQVDSINYLTGEFPVIVVENVRIETVQTTYVRNYGGPSFSRGTRAVLENRAVLRGKRVLPLWYDEQAGHLILTNSASTIQVQQTPFTYRVRNPEARNVVSPARPQTRECYGYDIESPKRQTDRLLDGFRTPEHLFCEVGRPGRSRFDTRKEIKTTPFSRLRRLPATDRAERTTGDLFAFERISRLFACLYKFVRSARHQRRRRLPVINDGASAVCPH